MNWYLSVLKNYAVFNGRARRQEFWMFSLISVIIAIGIGIVNGLIGNLGIIGTIYSLGLLIPSYAVSVRRLHDIGKSGWWILIGWIPILGIIVLLYFYTQDSQPGSNAYGPNPKES